MASEHLILLVTLSNDGVLLPTHLLRAQFSGVLWSIEQDTQRRRRRRAQRRRLREPEPEPEAAAARERHVGDEAVPSRRGVDAALQLTGRGAVVTVRRSSARYRVVLYEQRRMDILPGGGRGQRVVGSGAVADVAVDDQPVAQVETVERGTVTGGDVPGGRPAG